MSRDEPKPRIDAADTEVPTDVAAEESSSMSEELGAGSVAQMEKRLEEANRKAEENWDRFVRAQAEIENVRRRAEKDLQNAHKFALERFAKELLAVVDSLELGLQAAGANEANADGLREGMELTLKQLSSVLERFDVKPIDPAGERFNPEFHQAMATETDNEVEPNTVVRVFQKGYLLHDRLLRPALVVVAQRAPVSVGGEA
jgi:molecular chaperone GrpE